MERERKSIKETSLLSQSRKGPTRSYGATRNPESTPDYKHVVHNLTLSDTLQGLAIKYGVTVEQIRRVNKLWTNDNILIFKTLNIPVKLTYEGLTGNTSDNEDKPGTSRDNPRRCKDKPVMSKDKRGHKPSKNQECDSEESVDSGVHEVSHGDINVDVEGHSRIKSENPRMKNVASDSLSSFLKNLDGEMKASIQQAKKQRVNTVPVLIHNLEASHEDEMSKRHKQTDSNHVRLKSSLSSRTGTSRHSSQSLDEDNGSSLDDLFEL